MSYKDRFWLLLTLCSWVDLGFCCGWDWGSCFWDWLGCWGCWCGVCIFGCIGTGWRLLTTVGGCKKGTGAGRIGIGEHRFELGPLRTAVPVVLVGNAKLKGTGKLTCGRDGGSGMASGKGVLDAAAAAVGWGNPCLSRSCSFFFCRLIYHWLRVVWLISGSWICVSLITMPLFTTRSCMPL